jgi:hypothetical protein
LLEEIDDRIAAAFDSSIASANLPSVSRIDALRAVFIIST